MTFDPFSMQKQMFDQMEKSLGEYLEKVMREPDFMKVMSRNMSSALDVQSLVKDQVGKVLKSYHIPTEDSLESLYQSVHNMETRVLDLEELVEDLQDQVSDLEGQLAKAKKESSKVTRGTSAKISKDTSPKAESAQLAPAKKKAASKSKSSKKD